MASGHLVGRLLFPLHAEMIREKTAAETKWLCLDLNSRFTEISEAVKHLKKANNHNTFQQQMAQP